MLQAAIADPLIRSLFAAKWIPAIPIIQLLSISMAMHCVAEPCVALLQAQGRFAEMFRNYLIWTIGFLPIVAMAAKRGDGTTVAAAVASYYLVGSPIFFWSVTRRLGFAPLDVLRAYALPALASALSAALAIGVANVIRTPFILTIVVVSTIFGLTYTVLISVIAPEPWAEVRQLVRQLVPWCSPVSSAGNPENLIDVNHQLLKGLVSEDPS
jgi:O-antigen/teichoic acid export membrane protein